MGPARPAATETRLGTEVIPARHLSGGRRYEVSCKRLEKCSRSLGKSSLRPLATPAAHREFQIPIHLARGFHFLDCLSLVRCFSRTPGPLVSSAGMNSTPASSRAVWIFQNVSAEPRISAEASIRFTVAAPTAARSASCPWLSPSSARAALIWEGMIKAVDS